MAVDLKGALDPMLSGLTQMYRAANFGADATTLTVTQLRQLIDQVHSNFNAAKAQWTGVVAAVGAQRAKDALAERINPEPADVDAALATIQTDTFSLLSAYLGSVYANPGSPAWTYTASQSGGLIDGGHTDADVAAPTVTALNGLCATLRTSLLVLAPVE